MTTAVVAYSDTELALNSLTTKYKDVVYDTATSEGMFMAKAAYKEINSHSIILEKAREKEKAESLAYGRWVDSEAKRISTQLDALRLPIKTMIETETKRLEREKAEAERLAAEKLAAEEKAKKDAEEARMAAERAEIAQQQEELRKQQADAMRLIEEQQRESRRKIEEEERQARLAQQARDEVARVKAEQEAAALKAERDAIEAERRKAEDAAREIRRKEAELSDARTMLQTFVARFGKLPQFESIAGLIESFLNS